VQWLDRTRSENDEARQRERKAVLERACQGAGGACAPPACHSLAHMSAPGESEVALYRCACDAGDPEACTDLGMRLTELEHLDEVIERYAMACRGTYLVYREPAYDDAMGQLARRRRDDLDPYACGMYEFLLIEEGREEEARWIARFRPEGQFE
jgi:hypothetical protein